MQALQYLELDVPVCVLTEGVPPCMSAATGDAHCFNTKATCNDRENYSEGLVTLRFGEASAYRPLDIECLPVLVSIDYSPAIVSLGENLGQRASLRITLRDAPHSDTGSGFDPYLAERTYDPFRQGTLFGKFRARQPFLRGRNLRFIQGLVGQSIDDMDIRHFTIDSFDGPSPDGLYTLVAKDTLALVTGASGGTKKRNAALAPRISNGFLQAAIDADDMAITLQPSGIGDAEYPASGFLAVGGKEIISFTRVADAVTITGRGQLGTTATTHDAQDRAQLALRYVSEDPADLLRYWLNEYAGIDMDLIPAPDWLTETSSYFRRLFTGTIAEPTPVETLVNEIIEQAGLAQWWDDVGRQIRLVVLRQVASDAALFDDSNIVADGGRTSLQVKEQPAKRISQVRTYYGQINPLEGVDDPSNYRSVKVTVETDAEADYGDAAVKTIYSRWIPELASSTAERLNDILLGRYRDPPRRFTFKAFRRGDIVPQMGAGYQLSARTLQDANGARAQVPIRITSVKVTQTEYLIEAEENLFVSLDDTDLDNRVITYDYDSYNRSLRDDHDTIYPDPISGDEVTFVIPAGVTVGSTTSATAAIISGTWPVGVTVNLYVDGDTIGKGGAGGQGRGENAGYIDPIDGEDGGTALQTTAPINVILGATGRIAGGGGGGGGSATGDGADIRGGGGGGGAGATVGAAGAGGVPSGAEPGQPGTKTTGGTGGRSLTKSAPWAAPSLFDSVRGGTGGDLGEAGADGDDQFGNDGADGGVAGVAIDGISDVTLTDLGGQIIGAQIN